MFKSGDFIKLKPINQKVILSSIKTYKRNDCYYNTIQYWNPTLRKMDSLLFITDKKNVIKKLKSYMERLDYDIFDY